MGINAALPLLLSHPVTRAVEPTPPSITRNLTGPALTGPVVIGVNETISIWCSASGRARNRQELSGLLWRYGNGTRLPAIASGESTDVHVYEERSGGGAGTWRSVLHFKRAQPLSTGNMCRQLQSDLEKSKRASSCYRWVSGVYRVSAQNSLTLLDCPN